MSNINTTSPIGKPTIEDIKWLVALKEQRRTPKGKRKNKFYINKSDWSKNPDHSITDRLEQIGYIKIWKVNNKIAKVVITLKGREAIEMYNGMKVL